MGHFLDFAGPLCFAFHFPLPFRFSLLLFSNSRFAFIFSRLLHFFHFQNKKKTFRHFWWRNYIFFFSECCCFWLSHRGFFDPELFITSSILITFLFLLLPRSPSSTSPFLAFCKTSNLVKNDTGKETKDEKESEGRWIIRSSSVVGNDEVSTSNFFFFFRSNKNFNFFVLCGTEKNVCLNGRKRDQCSKDAGKV